MTKEESPAAVEKTQRRRRQPNKIDAKASKAAKATKNQTDLEKNKSKPSKRRGNQKKKTVKKLGVNDYKYQEIRKLIKSFFPVTINGIPTQTIIDRIIQDSSNEQSSGMEDSREASPAVPKDVKLSKKEKNEVLGKFLLNYFANDNEAHIYLSFKIKPSDPDFPYDLESLNISLCIPGGYPYNKEDKPTITVLNEEIPKGFSINIELGFKRIVRIAMLGEVDEEISLNNGKGLLSQIQTLDKYLELFLKQERKETIKIIKYKKTGSPKPENNKREEKKEKQPKDKPKNKKKEANLNEVDSEILQYREKLVNEFLNKKLDTALLKKGRTESKYRVLVPILKDNSTIPEVWRLEKKVDLVISIPISYPKSQLKLAVADNYSKNAILKHGKHDTYPAVREREMYLVNNFNVYDFKSDSILAKLNFLTNNLGLFCLDFKEFAEYRELITSLITS